MAVEGTNLTQPGEPGSGGRLADILADMLRSALAWEEENSSPQETGATPPNAVKEGLLPASASSNERR